MPLWVASWLTVAMAVFAGVPAFAAAPEGAVLQMQNPLECLAPLRSQRPAVDYPAGIDGRSEGGIVRVRLRFNGPEIAPTVEVFYRSGPPELVQAVRDYVEVYRLPCLTGGEAVVATQEFQFVPGDKVIWADARHEHVGPSLLDCVQHPPHDEMRFPTAATRARVDRGVLLARMRFESAESSPKVDVFVADRDSGRFESEVRRHLANFRMPCLPPDSRPVAVVLPVEFRLADSGGPLWRFRDVSLKQFVGAIRDVDRQRVRFDFTTMACPFDILLRLWQPFMPNDVRQVGAADPNRRELVEWMSTVSLALSTEQLRDVITKPLAISVPCGVLDLR